MTKLLALLITSLSLVGCVHKEAETNNPNLEFRVRVLEKRLLLLEMDIDDILDECPVENLK